MSVTTSQNTALNAIRSRPEWKDVLAYNELTMNV